MKQKFHYNIHESLKLYPVLSQVNQIHTLPYFLNTNFNIILMSSEFQDLSSLQVLRLNFAFTSHVKTGMQHGSTKATLATIKSYKDSHYESPLSQFLSHLNSGFARR